MNSLDLSRWEAFYDRCIDREQVQKCAVPGVAVFFGGDAWLHCVCWVADPGLLRSSSAIREGGRSRNACKAGLYNSSLGGGCRTGANRRMIEQKTGALFVSGGSE